MTRVCQYGPVVTTIKVLNSRRFVTESFFGLCFDNNLPMWVDLKIQDIFTVDQAQF